MRKFLLLFILFLVPVTLFLGTLEALVQTVPNSYSYKHNYIVSRGNKIHTVSLGHSQLYDGFMPESFKLPSFNLCNSAQSYKDDYYLLQELLPYMPNLKLVILPIGYVNVKNEDNDGFSERSTFYHEYMNIDYDNSIPLLYQYEALNPQRAFDKLTSYYWRHVDIVGCDTLGRRSTHNLIDRRHKLGHDKILYDYTISSKKKMYIQSDVYLEKIGQMLEAKQIKLVLVSPPYYWSCFDKVNVYQKTFLQKSIKDLKEKMNFQYINMEDDDRFVDEDFYNETHLSEIGADKFTKILNDSISL